MKALRVIAAVIYLLLGLVYLAGAAMIGWLRLRHIRPMFDSPSTLSYPQMIGIAVVFGLVLLAAAWQLWRGHGRTLAWIVAVMLVPGSVISWKLLPVAYPLLYLVIEALAPRFSSKPRTEAEQTTAKASHSELLLWLVAIPVSFGATYFLNHLPGVTQQQGYPGLLALAGSLWLIIVLHELGHALAGWRMDFDLVRFAVFPVDINTMGRLHVKPFWGMGGFYLGLPRTHENLWRRHVTMVAAGPVANLATFFVCWAVLALAGAWLAAPVRGFLHTLMEGSLILGLVNLAPMKLGPLKLDGRLLWDAFFNPAESRRAMASLGCMTSRSATLRPRDWPAEWVSALRGGEEDDLGAWTLLNVWASDRLLANAQDAEAWETLQASTEGIERAGPKLPDKQGAAAMRLHVAWLRARYDGQVDPRMEEYLVEARKDPATETYELLRMEAAVRLSSGRNAEVPALLQQAAEDLASKPQTGLRMADMDDIREMQRLAA